MRRTILVLVGLVAMMVLLTACATQTTPTTPPVQEGELAPDGVDVLPDIDLSSCLTEIKQTNPEMSEQDARDNCLTLEAVNTGNQALCDQVSAGFKETCLAAFG